VFAVASDKLVRETEPIDSPSL